MNKILGYLKRNWVAFGVAGSVLGGLGMVVRNSGIANSPVTYSQAEYVPAGDGYCAGESVEWQHSLEWRDYNGPLNQRQMLRHYHGAAIPQVSRELLLIIDENTPAEMTVLRSFYLDRSLELESGQYEIVVYTYSPIDSRTGAGYSVPFDIRENCGGPEVPEPSLTSSPSPSGTAPVVLPSTTPTPTQEGFPNALTVTPTPFIPRTPTATSTPRASSSITPTKVPTPLAGTCTVPARYPCYTPITGAEYLAVYTVNIRSVPSTTGGAATIVAQRKPGDHVVVQCFYEVSEFEVWASAQPCLSLVSTWTAVIVGNTQYLVQVEQ